MWHKTAKAGPKKWEEPEEIIRKLQYSFDVDCTHVKALWRQSIDPIDSN